VDSRATRLTVLVLAVGTLAFAIGGVFVGRAFAGEDPTASWTSAAMGLVGGGCCVAYGIVRLGRR
jgi:hypothetical protein